MYSWDSTYIVIKRLLELQNSIEVTGVLSPEFHLSTAIWSSLNELLSVLKVRNSVCCKFKTSSRKFKFCSFYGKVMLFKTYATQKPIFACFRNSYSNEKKRKIFISIQTLFGFSFCKCEITHSAF